MYGYEIGQVLRRRELHERFDGQRQGGIATPSKHPLILVFTGGSGNQHGYEDGWADRVFCYFGEGQLGDMTFERGNLAIRDHVANGKDLLLFRMVRKGYVEFVGPFIAASWEYRNAPDRNDALRQAIVFHLSPLSAPAEEDAAPARSSAGLSLEELRRRAWRSGRDVPQRSAESAARAAFERSEDVRDYALARANGRCEDCGSEAPFRRSDGQPYLEVHHLRRLSDGGPDMPNSVAAVCPTCHRWMHHGKDGRERNARVAERIASLERSLGDV